MTMIGLPRDCLPLPVMHQQWALVTSVFASDTFLSSEDDMNLELQKEIESFVEGGSLRFFHKLGLKHHDCSDKLAELCGNKKNPKSMTNIFKFYFNRDPEDLLGYKNNEIKILGDENSELF